MEERALLRAVAEAAESLLAVMPKDGDVSDMEARQRRVLAQAVTDLRDWDERPRRIEELEGEPDFNEEPWFQGMIRPKTRACESCNARIFFAHQNERWMPMEPHPVEAHSVIPSWRYVVTFVDPPYVEVKPTLQHGPVWVDHRQTCGSRDDGPRFKVSPYQKRWVINKTRADLAGDDLAAALMALRDRLDNRESPVDL